MEWPTSGHKPSHETPTAPAASRSANGGWRRQLHRLLRGMGGHGGTRGHGKGLGDVEHNAGGN